MVRHDGREGRLGEFLIFATRSCCPPRSTPRSPNIMAANNPIIEAAEEGGEPSKQRKLGSKVNEIIEKSSDLRLQIAEKGASLCFLICPSVPRNDRTGAISSPVSRTPSVRMCPPLLTNAPAPLSPPLPLSPLACCAAVDLSDSLLSSAGIDGLLKAGELIPIVEKIAALMIIIKEMAKKAMETVRDARQKVGW